VRHQSARRGSALQKVGIERRGHDVSTLVAQLRPQRPVVATLLDKAKILDQYYIPTRCGNAFGAGSATSHYTQAQAEQAIQFATEIFEEMKRVVEGGAEEAQ
jgi:HEPN domain-containing protein